MSEKFLNTLFQETPPSLWERLTQEAGLNVEGEVWAFQPDPKKSLVQLFRVLHRSIDEAFALPMVRVLRFWYSAAAAGFVYSGVSLTSDLNGVPFWFLGD